MAVAATLVASVAAAAGKHILAVVVVAASASASFGSGEVSKSIQTMIRTSVAQVHVLKAAQTSERTREVKVDKEMRPSRYESLRRYSPSVLGSPSQGVLTRNRMVVLARRCQRSRTHRTCAC